MRILFLICAACWIPMPVTAQGFQTESARGRITVGFGPTFNRVEGLPFMVGPIIETLDPKPIRFRGVAIVRAEPDITPEVERVGFQALLQKSLDTTGTWSVGLSGWAEVESIEDRGLTDLELSLGGFVFHDDRRDYYESIGVGVHALYSPPDDPFDIGVEFRYEDHSPLAASSPASLIDARARWRPQTVVADGFLLGISALARYDTRSGRRIDPITGWLLEATAYRSLTSDLVRPPMLVDNAIMVTAAPFDDAVTTGKLDLRRYNALGPIGVNLRAVAGGSITGNTLPSQFQTAIGGDGTLPGHDLFALDCGGHISTSILPSTGRADLFHPFYGCDRYVMFGAEIEGYLGFRLGGDSPPSVPLGNLDLASAPQWVLFANAARGWTHQEGFLGATDQDFLYDVGAGLTLGDVGVYGAYPLDQNDATIKFVFRLQRRF